MGDKSKKNGMPETKEVIRYYRRSLTTVKLNGSNYLPWSHAMTVSLCASSESSYITDDPFTDSTWSQHDAHIMTFLWNSLEPDIFENVACLETSKAVWDTLKELYSSNQNTSQLASLSAQILSGKEFPTVGEAFAHIRWATTHSFGLEHSIPSALVALTASTTSSFENISNHNTPSRNSSSKCGGRHGGRLGTKKCNHCSATNHDVEFYWKLHGKPTWANPATLEGEPSALAPTQIIISKAEYDSMVQRANASSSSSIATHVASGVKVARGKWAKDEEVGAVADLHEEG
ncbi:hypothetical protein Vadar_015466 [Vaccinium darrowii]|uniref:Uncharacterized protein n=1 Tax=Vaccinium darrowii TaxID=229202 RepID=A0ACB7Y6W7_9ERIC|nr:hypothetical protein Vadar_015466 [Vaccinium darrowii]